MAIHFSTVGQLRDRLPTLAASMLVVVASDEEGNSFHPMGQASLDKMVVGGIVQQVLVIWPDWDQVERPGEED
jgi:hypothetical protein